MEKLKKGHFYLIGNEKQKELVIIDDSELHWINLELKRKPIIKSIVSNKLNRDQALTSANEKIVDLNKIKKDLEIKAADERGDETENIEMLEKKITKIRNFKKRYLFKKKPEE